MLSVIEVVSILVVLAMVLYHYLTSTFDFWKSRGIPGPKPVPVFGTIGDVIRCKHNLVTYLQSVYDNYRAVPLVGIYYSRRPVLVVNDLSLIKDILIKDFSVFPDHGNHRDPHDPLTENLFNLDLKRWRLMRAKLAPIFTSGKLKEMFYLLVQCSQVFDNYLGNIDHSGVDVRDLAGKFATDVIGLCVLGVQANSFTGGDNVIQRMSNRLYDMNLRNVVKENLRFYFPGIYNIVGSFLQDRNFNKFFIDLTKETIEDRKKNGTAKHDFIALLIKIKDDPNAIDDLELTDELLAAQLTVFFGTGFETTADAISNALFELALNPKLQEKLREEIFAGLKMNNGQISYDVVKNMKFLDCVFKETLRKYPPAGVLQRRAAESYTFSGTNVTIPKGQFLSIPLYAIQRDPRYFFQPEVFRPERFGDDQDGENHPDMSFVPFGDGPRHCIGSRFAVMLVKIGLITVLKSYVLEVCERTDRTYEINKRSFLLQPKNGIILNMKEIPRYIY